MDMVYKHNKYNKDNNSNNKRKHGQGRELFYAPSKGVCVLFVLFVDVVGGPIGVGVGVGVGDGVDLGNGVDVGNGVVYVCMDHGCGYNSSLLLC